MATTTRKLTVPKKGEPEESKIEDAVVIEPEDLEKEVEETEEDEELEDESEEDEELELLTDEEKAKLKAEAKEAKKKAAFEKLREMNAQKKAVRQTELQERTTTVQGKLKKGDVKFSTRASYYGVKCRVEKVEEVRGRVLVTVTCMTTKGGQDLPEERYYTRRFSPEFLQDDKPTEAYVPRRGGAVKVKKVSKAEQKRRDKQSKDAVKQEAKASGEELEENESDEEELELEDEEDEDDSEEDEDSDSWA